MSGLHTDASGEFLARLLGAFGSVRLYFGFIAPVSAPHPAGSAP